MSKEFIRFNEYVDAINNIEEFDSDSKFSSDEAFDFATMILP